MRLLFEFASDSVFIKLDYWDSNVVYGWVEAASSSEEIGHRGRRWPEVMAWDNRLGDRVHLKITEDHNNTVERTSRAAWIIYSKVHSRQKFENITPKKLKRVKWPSCRIYCIVENRVIWLKVQNRQMGSFDRIDLKLVGVCAKSQKWNPLFQGVQFWHLIGRQDKFKYRIPGYWF